MLIIFRFPEFGESEPPKPGDLIAVDPDCQPVDLYLTPDDREIIHDMPKDSASILAFPNGMPMEEAERAVGKDLPKSLRKVTRLVGRKGGEDGRAKA